MKLIWGLFLTDFSDERKNCTNTADAVSVEEYILIERPIREQSRKSVSFFYKSVTLTGKARFLYSIYRSEGKI